MRSKQAGNQHGVGGKQKIQLEIFLLATLGQNVGKVDL
jgi:hypothetical protein